MRVPEYIILTPTAPFKLYSLERFLKNIISFRPRPKEMVFCAESGAISEIKKWKTKLKNKGIKLVILKLKPEIIKKFPGYNIKKLTYSRENLRNYFINSKYEWALWLDCDIIPEPNVFKVLLKIAQSEKCLVITNEYRSRMTEGLIIPGTGCTLTHKAACMFAKFQIASLIWKEKEVGRLADDFWFFVMLSTADSWIKKWIGWSSQRKNGRFVSISHINERGEIKFLERDKIKNKRVGDKL